MVAVLDVYFNDDPVIKNADAKVGEQVKMNIHSRNALNGMAIGNTDFTITMANGRRRDGLTTGFTDTSNGEMQFDDVGYVAGQVYHGITDANGDATIILTQKKGVGLLTPLNIAPVDSLISTPVSRSVKFTVATSPDTPAAKMWGHMADTITVGDWTFERPKLAGEVSNPLRTRTRAMRHGRAWPIATRWATRMRAAARRTACRASTSLRRCITPTAAARFTAFRAGRPILTTGRPPTRAPPPETDRADERQ